MNERDDWNPSLPSEIPSPTWTPAAVAFGVTLIFWGIVTSPLVSLAGLLVIGTALAVWIGEMCND